MPSNIKKSSSKKEAQIIWFNEFFENNPHLFIPCQGKNNMVEEKLYR